MGLGGWLMLRVSCVDLRRNKRRNRAETRKRVASKACESYRTVFLILGHWRATKIIRRALMAYPQHSCIFKSSMSPSFLVRRVAADAKLCGASGHSARNCDIRSFGVSPTIYLWTTDGLLRYLPKAPNIPHVPPAVISASLRRVTTNHIVPLSLTKIIVFRSSVQRLRMRVKDLCAAWGQGRLAELEVCVVSWLASQSP